MGIQGKFKIVSVRDDSDREYIRLPEAMLCTGLSEKTLKTKLRGRVLMIGHCSWSRKEFFDFWQYDDDAKHRKKIRDAVVEVISGGK